jgi:two-component system sensor histidine kinase BaeS
MPDRRRRGDAPDWPGRDPGGPPWRGGRGWRREGGRPPWWPENETFPPQDRAGWRRLRRRFLVRAAVFAVVVLSLLFGLSALLVWGLAVLLGQQLLVGLLGLLVALLFVFAAGRILRGVRGSAGAIGDLIEGAGRIEAGDLSARVTERGPREVRALARAFNAMGSRLDETEESRRRLLADLSHELRTPLAVIQGNLEAIVDGVYPADEVHLAPILDEARLMAGLVEDLRALALSESPALRLEREPTSIAGLLREAADGFAAQADQRGVAVNVAAEGDAVADIDPVRIRQVIANLLSNALRHTPSGGSIALSARSRGSDVEVSVADTGAGVAEDVLPRIFERFYRSPDSPGSGLGLAIARNLVVAHDGEIGAESAPGRGTTVRFTLPTSRPGDAA